jgi:hypothetical protein
VDPVRLATCLDRSAAASGAIALTLLLATLGGKRLPLVGSLPPTGCLALADSLPSGLAIVGNSRGLGGMPGGPGRYCLPAAAAAAQPPADLGDRKGLG